VKLSATKLRQDIYRVLDEILESGIPVEIDRKGRLLRIVPVDPPRMLSKLERRSYLTGDPEEIVHLDWSSEWRP
jgi:antitoxin (DNA-binding transcriptional repressor) of toxin-antitoxin stability system